MLSEDLESQLSQALGRVEEFRWGGEPGYELVGFADWSYEVELIRAEMADGQA